jgi:hypothetical protein
MIVVVDFGLSHYGSKMIANFYGAIYGWSVCMIATMAINLFTQCKPAAELRGITYHTDRSNEVCPRQLMDFCPDSDRGCAFY